MTEETATDIPLEIMDSMSRGSARVTIHDGHTVLELGPSDRVTFGRDSATDLVFHGDPRLSRQAGEISGSGSGVVVTNLSRKHSLFVHSSAGRIRLPPVTDDAAPAALFLGGGTFEVTVPNWEASGCRIVVEVESAAGAEDPPASVRAQTETHYALRLNPDTKEFVTALMLCRSKLQAGPAAAVPPVPELTRQVLEATGSWHLVRDFDLDPAVRARLSGRIHEHLKQLRAKLIARALAPPGALAPPVIADVLIDNDIIVPAHLALLTDPDWLATQADLWWS